MAKVAYIHRIESPEGEEISKRVVKGDDDFTKVYNKHWRTIREISRECSGAVGLFTLLVENMNQSNAVVISRETISDLLGISKSTASRYIRYLRERNIVQVVQTGNSNIFHMNADVVWKNTADKKRYAKLEAAVVLSPTEMARDPFDVEVTHAKIVTAKAA